MKYEDATVLLFNLIEKKGWHIEDVKYLDGYFIFEMEKGSVIHFHVKECKDWIFAIWWNTEEDITTGEFFCQYEPTVDKFKPSRSVYNQIIKFSGEPTEDCIYEYGICDVLEYIHKNPILAWGHDYYYWDYNLKYVPYVKALWKFIGYKFENVRKKIITPILDKSFVKFTEKLFAEMIQDEIDNLGWKYEVVDEGEYTSPRYGVVVELPDGFDKEYQDTGCFGMFETDSEEEKKWRKRRDLYRKISDFFGVYWCRPIDDFVVFSNKKEHEEFLRRIDSEDD